MPRPNTPSSRTASASGPSLRAKGLVSRFSVPRASRATSPRPPRANDGAGLARRRRRVGARRRIPTISHRATPWALSSSRRSGRIGSSCATGRTRCSPRSRSAVAERSRIFWLARAPRAPPRSRPSCRRPSDGWHEVLLLRPRLALVGVVLEGQTSSRLPSVPPWQEGQIIMPPSLGPRAFSRSGASPRVTLLATGMIAVVALGTAGCYPSPPQATYRLTIPRRRAWRR